jgi:hypothetical protein
VTGQLQGEVGFDAGVQLAGAVLVDIPPAVRELPAADVGHALLLEHRIDLPGPVHVGDVIGTKRGIYKELAAPVAVRLLEVQKIPLGAPDGCRDSLVPRTRGRRLGENHVRRIA